MLQVLTGAGRRGWLGSEPWWKGDPNEGITRSSIEFDVPIGKVATALARALKPGRRTVSVIRVSGGKIEEVSEATVTAKVEAAKEAAKATDKDVVAATVALPERGCPAPAFEEAELKATRVLKAFLCSRQLADFEHRNAFVSVGADTGERYAITSRHATGLLAERRRSLYNLDRGMPLCVHDWTVPAAEEMLALNILLRTPGGETWLAGGTPGMEMPEFGRPG